MDGHNQTPAQEQMTDLREHNRTFAGFIRFLMWLFGLSIAAVIFAALANA